MTALQNNKLNTPLYNILSYSDSEAENSSQTLINTSVLLCTVMETDLLIAVFTLPFSCGCMCLDMKTAWKEGRWSKRRYWTRVTTFGVHCVINTSQLHHSLYTTYCCVSRPLSEQEQWTQSITLELTLHVWPSSSAALSEQWTQSITLELTLHY